MKSKLILMLFALFAWGNDNPFAPPQSIDENAILNDFEKKMWCLTRTQGYLKALALLM